jgi:transcriptional regulator with XRE-family HTH domain
MDLQTVHIGQKIKKLRELKNLTQSYMATELGLTQGAYSKIEVGESEITYNKLEKISGLLGMKPEEVIAFNDQMVFNIMNNPHGGNVFSHIDQQGISSSERKLYEEQIQSLKEEVSHLKKIVDKLMNK